VTLRATDDEGASATSSAVVTVNNLAPTIDLQGMPDPVNEGDVFTLTLGNVIDPGNDTVTAYSVAWGDGAAENFTVAADGVPTGRVLTHMYADGGAAPLILVTLTDEDGTFDAGSLSHTVNNVPPTIALQGATLPVNPDLKRPFGRFGLDNTVLDASGQLILLRIVARN